MMPNDETVSDCRHAPSFNYARSAVRASSSSIMKTSRIYFSDIRTPGT